MADITKDSFLESNRHTKVVFQRGRDVPDCDLNELQDILRSFMYRQFWSGIQGITLNPAAVDASWKIVQNTGDTANKVKATGYGSGASGYLFCDGVGIFLGVDEEITGEAPDHLFVNNDTDDPRIDGLYLRVTEEEVSDPHPFNILGETARRRKLQYSWYVDTRDADPPDSSDPYTDPIWSGGVRYFKMATITRPAHTSEILDAQILDNRFLLLQEAFSKIVREANHEIQALVAHTLETDQPYQFFDVDLPNARMLDKGCGFVWAAGRDGVGDTGYRLGELTALPASTILQGLFSLKEGYAFGCKNGTRFWDNLLVTDTPPVRLTEGNEVANQLKMLGKYVGGHQGSILRTLNARVGISVGDGINTFGDFNGTNALYDAFMYFMDHIYIAGSITSCVIFVKGGTHNLDGDHIITTSEGVQLFFVGEGSQSELYLGNFVQATIQIPNGTLVFRDIKVTASFTDKEAVLARHVQIFTSIFTADVIAHRSALVRDSTLASTLPLQLNIKEYVASGYNTLVDNSNITGTNEILKIVTTDGASGSGDLRIFGITFTNSKLNSARGITVDNHTSNAGKLFLNEVIIDKCQITGSSLLAIYATNTKRFRVTRVLIQGVTYEATADADTTFFIGCLNAGGTDLLEYVDEIIMKDILLNYSIPTTFGTVIKTQAAPSWVTTEDWGTLTISAERVVLQNICMRDIPSGSTLADMFVYNCKLLNMKGVNLFVSNLGSVLPNQRIWVFPQDVGTDTFWNERVVDSVSILFHGNDGSARLALTSALKITPSGNLTVCNSTISKIGNGANAIRGITLAEGGAVPANSNIDGLTLLNNTISIIGGMATAIKTYLPTRSVKQLNIKENKISDNSATTSYGIAVFAKNLIGNICNNSVILNVGTDGIRVEISDDTVVSRIVFLGNCIYSSLATDTYITISNTSLSNPIPKVVMLGNIATYINVAYITMLTEVTGGNPDLTGFETKYSTTTEPGYALPIYESNHYMMRNVAKLLKTI